MLDSSSLRSILNFISLFVEGSIVNGCVYFVIKYIFCKDSLHMIAVWFSKFMVAIMFIVTAMYIVMAIINTVMIIYLKSFGLSTSLIIAVMSLYMSMQVEKMYHTIV